MPAYTYAIQQSRQALKRGDRLAARRWAEQAATLDLTREDPWLILAAVASPRASIEYLKRALEINPSSTRARRGMHWAVRRYRKEQPHRVIGDTLPTRAASAALLPVSSAQPAPMQPDRLGSRAYVWATLLVLITIGLLLWSNPPAFLQPDQLNYSVAAAQAWAVKATFTATPTATFAAPPPPPEATALPASPTAVPTPTVVHSMIPADMKTSGSLIYDVDSKGTGPEGRAPYGDSYKLNRFERPFTQDMTYLPDLDIVHFRRRGFRATVIQSETRQVILRRVPDRGEVLLKQVSHFRCRLESIVRVLRQEFFDDLS